MMVKMAVILVLLLYDIVLKTEFVKFILVLNCVLLYLYVVTKWFN